MPNFALALKAEIRRLAKKEVKAETGSTKNAVAKQRHEIAALKRLLDEQERAISLLTKRVSQSNEPEPQDAGLDGVRHSARSVKSQRRRLGLSARDFGKLIGVSGLTVYNWEHGKSRPRKAQVLALAGLRKIGKRDAVAKLAALQSEGEKLSKRKPR